MDNDLSVGEALSAFRKANGVDCDASPTWTCDVGPLRLRLPNFRWRREAIPLHDLHHILTGYPCSMRGEFQMAAWEFAAGRFPHPAATLFCLPLVTAGMLWSPSSMWAAFRSGRRARSLYRFEVTETFLRSPLRSLRADLPLPAGPNARPGDGIAFCFLVAQASLPVLAPAVAAAVVALAF